MKTKYIFAAEQKMKEGDAIVPFSFSYMQAETIIQTLEKLADQVLTIRPDLFRVRIRIKPTNNIRVYIDGDNGITIDDCIKINKTMYKLIEEKAYYPDGNYSLEVSSPGIDEPLILHRQYVKNIGRKIEVILLDDTNKEGILTNVSETDIEVEIKKGKGKKLEIEKIVIPISNIKSTTVQVIF